MASELKVSTKKLTGRRPDLSQQPSIFPVLSEEPVSAAKQQAAAVSKGKTARVFAWIGTVLVWLPLFLSIVYYIYIAIEQTPYALFYVSSYSPCCAHRFC